jgi:hypothetical protein
MPGRAQRPDLPYARLQAALRLHPRRECIGFLKEYEKH